MDVNALSFVATVLATVAVVGICVYGAVKFFASGNALSGIVALITIPMWFVAQILMIVFYDAMSSRGIATREYHLDYAVTPILNLVGAGVVWFVVIHNVKKLRVPPVNGNLRVSQSSDVGGAGISLEPRKVAGLLFVIVGAIALASWFFFGGVLLVIVGVSLIFDVRIWRS